MDYINNHSNTTNSKKPPTIHIQPRDMVHFPSATVKIQSPPPKPTPVTTSPISIILPLVGTLIGVIVMIIAYSSMGNGAFPIFVFISLPMMIVSVGGGFLNFRRAKKNFDLETTKRETICREHLAIKRAEIEKLAREQRDASVLHNPDPEICVEWVKKRSHYLWFRTQENYDFLHMRLGTGRLKRSFDIEVPANQTLGANQDDYFLQANSIEMAYREIEDCSINLPIGDFNNAGLIGSKAELQLLGRNILMQLAVNHSPNEVKVILLVPENEISAWKWARWLPHLWDNKKQDRYFPIDRIQSSKMMGNLEEIFLQRANIAQSEKNVFLGENAQPLPIYVFFIADSKVWSSQDYQEYSQLFNLITNRGKELGGRLILLSEQANKIPQSCGISVEIKDKVNKLKYHGENPKEYIFTVDETIPAKAEYLSRLLAPLRLESNDNKADSIPDKVPFLSMYNANRVEELPILQNWKLNDPDQSLGVPIGKRAGGKLMFLDIQDGKDGPNGLIAGTVGSGKTELMRSLVLSLAIYFHPHKVNFVLMDFKGGSFSSGLRKLPHVVNTISDMEINDVPRALKFLEQELTKRKNLFEKAALKTGENIQNLSGYHKLVKKGEITDDIPYLIFIVDEFTFLKNKYGSEMDKFITIATQGRAYGFRMLLATQKPAGVINEQINANTQYRLCLKVVSIQDSKEVIGIGDAANLVGIGRAIVRVNAPEKEYIDRFQAAWATAPYFPVQSELSPQVFALSLVELNGNRKHLNDRLIEQKRKSEHYDDQFSIIMDHLIKVAENEKIEKLPGPWIDKLPEVISLFDIQENKKNWRNAQYEQNQKAINPIIGICESPEQQLQEVLTLNFNKYNHFTIFGANGSGKLLFVQTLISSLVLNYSPNEISIYIIDFGSLFLKPFEMLPHVGAVISYGETERVLWLYQLIHSEFKRRQKTHMGSNSEEQNSKIIIIVQNFPAYKQTFDNEIKNSALSFLNDIASKGSTLGFHLVISTDQVEKFDNGLKANIDKLITLQLNDKNNYPGVSSDFKNKELPNIYGRGLITEIDKSKTKFVMEFQTAYPVIGENEGERAKNLKNLIHKINDGWSGNSVQKIPYYPEPLHLESMISHTSKWEDSGLSIPLAKDVSNYSLHNVDIDIKKEKHLWISGYEGSGKTNLLISWMMGIAEKYSPELVKFFVVDPDKKIENLKSLPHIYNYISDPNHLQTMDLEEDVKKFLDVKSELTNGLYADKNLVFIFDSFGDYKTKLSKNNVEFLKTVAGQKNGKIHILMAGNLNDFLNSENQIGKIIKEQGAGILLGCTKSSELITGNFTINIPASYQNKELLPGAGFFVRGKAVLPIQIAKIDVKNKDLDTWVKHILKKGKINS